MHAPFLQASWWVQSWPSLHPVWSGWLPLSTQVIAPVLHWVIPTLHWLGFVVQDAPAVQLTQIPRLLQTMFGPQAVPAGRCVVLLQTIVPVLQLVMPVKQTFGLPVQVWFAVHAPQVPLPSQT